MHMLIPSWVNVWIISKLLFIGFSIFPGNNWVLEAGREYAITVSVYDKLNHKIIVTEVSWTLFLVVSVPVHVWDVHHCSITEMYCRAHIVTWHHCYLGTYCLLDVCVLPGTWHHLLSAYVLHNEQWEIVTRNTFSGHPEVRRSYIHRFSLHLANTKLASHTLCCLWGH